MGSITYRGWRNRFYSIGVFWCVVWVVVGCGELFGSVVSGQLWWSCWGEMPVCYTGSAVPKIHPVSNKSHTGKELYCCYTLCKTSNIKLISKLSKSTQVHTPKTIFYLTDRWNYFLNTNSWVNFNYGMKFDSLFQLKVFKLWNENSLGNLQLMETWTITSRVRLIIPSQILFRYLSEHEKINESSNYEWARI